jgi:hypothetical protein
MPCVRCKGPMVQDHSYDLLESSGSLHIEAWRCIFVREYLRPTESCGTDRDERA